MEDEEETGPRDDLQDDGANIIKFENNRAGTKEMCYLGSRNGEGLYSVNFEQTASAVSAVRF